jgi:hypothetical protein
LIDGKRHVAFGPQLPAVDKFGRVLRFSLNGSTPVIEEAAMVTCSASIEKCGRQWAADPASETGFGVMLLESASDIKLIRLD